MASMQATNAPLAIELYAGMFGWGEGLVSEGWSTIGFDIVHEDYHGPVPKGCDLVLQDVLTLHGSQFRNADLIVASPPCQQYSLWGMRMFYPNPPQPDLTLWQAAIRIAKEADLPLIIENVRGAQYFWGKAAHRIGPYHFWGDVPAIWPVLPIKRKNVIDDMKKGNRRGQTNARFSSSSIERRKCTAQAAKIPIEIAQYIGQVFKPA